MRVRALSASITLLLAAPSLALAESAHSFKGNIGLQHRSNTNIGVAPASGSGFDFADLSEFGKSDEEDQQEGEEEEDDDDGDDDSDFDDDIDLGFDEDELEQADAVDEDGDGIDDILDPDDGGAVDKQRRTSIKLGLSHKLVVGEGSAWVNSLKLSNDTHADRSDLDKLNSAVSSGWEFARKGSPHKFKPSLSYITLEKDSRKFVSTWVASLAYQYEVSKALSLSVAYNYQNKDITSPQAPDSRVDTLSFGADIKLSKDDIVKLKYAPKVEDSTKTTRNTDAYGWDITYTRRLPWDMTAGIGYGFDSVRFVNLSPSRKDDNDTYAFELNKSFGKKFELGFGYETRTRKSNIPGKDADNDSYYLNGGWKF